MRIKILHKGLAIIALPLMFQFVFACAYFSLLSGAASALRREESWQATCVTAQQLEYNFQQAILLSLLYALSGSEDVKRLQNESVHDFAAATKQLNADAEKQGEPLGDLIQRVQRIAGKIKMLSLFLRHRLPMDVKISEMLARVPGRPAALSPGQNLMRLMQVYAGKSSYDILSKAELTVQERRAEFDRTSNLMSSLLAIMLALNVLISLALAAYFSRGVSSRLVHVEENTRLLSIGGQPGAPILGSDEIAQVDAAVHVCAKQILELESFKGQMAAVVSAELKAPLSSVQKIISSFAAGAYGEISESTRIKALGAEQNLSRLLLLETNRNQPYPEGRQQSAATEKLGRLKGRRFNLLQKGLLLLAAPILINFVLLLSLKSMWSSVLVSLDHAREASSISNNLVLIGDNIGRSLWYVLFTVGSESDSLRKEYSTQKDHVAELVKSIEQAASHNRRREAAWLQVIGPGSRILSSSEKIISMNGDLTAGQMLKIWPLADSKLFEEALSLAQDVEKKTIAKEGMLELKAMGEMQISLVLVPLFNLVLSVLIALIYARSISGRLANVALNANRLSNRQKLSDPVGGADEIGDLDFYLHQVASRIIELEEYKVRMIGIASHELSPLLSTLLSSLELFQAGASGPISNNAAAKLAIAREEIAGLLRLINNLLDFDKLPCAGIKLD